MDEQGVCRGVNRYLAEFRAADPGRLRNPATVPLADPLLAAGEARYAVVERNAVAVFAPSGGHAPQPLWTAIDVTMPPRRFRPDRRIMGDTVCRLWEGLIRGPESSRKRDVVRGAGP